MFDINFCQWLDLNSGPLESDVTALPTEPQPLPWLQNFCVIEWNCNPPIIKKTCNFRLLIKGLGVVSPLVGFGVLLALFWSLVVSGLWCLLVPLIKAWGVCGWRKPCFVHGMHFSQSKVHDYLIITLVIKHQNKRILTYFARGCTTDLLFD